MIEIKMTGICENCTCADLFLDCINIESFNGDYDMTKWSIGCKHERVCNKRHIETAREQTNTEALSSKDAIKALPSAQPVFMWKRGKWIDTGDMDEWWAEVFTCSECGWSMLGTANYCPNCGADMREPD